MGLPERTRWRPGPKSSSNRGDHLVMGGRLASSSGVGGSMTARSSADGKKRTPSDVASSNIRSTNATCAPKPAG